MLSLKELLKESLLEADEQAIDNALDKAAKQYKVSPEELRKAYELINQGALDEGAKDVLKKMLTPLMVTALMSLPSNVLAQDKKADLPTPKASMELTKFGKASEVSTDMLKDWDAFINWLKATSVNDIDGSGDTSKLSGNAKMDKKSFNDKVLKAYKRIKPDSKVLDVDQVKSLQSAMVNHRNGTIEADKVNQKNKYQGVELAGGQFRNTDYSEYLPFIKAIEDKKNREGDFDGFIGRYTSKTVPPRDLTKSKELKQVDRTAQQTSFAPTPTRKSV